MAPAQADRREHRGGIDGNGDAQRSGHRDNGAIANTSVRRSGGDNDLHQNVRMPQFALRGRSRRRGIRRRPCVPNLVHAFEIPLEVLQPDLCGQQASLVGASIGEELLDLGKGLPRKGWRRPPA